MLLLLTFLKQEISVDNFVGLMQVLASRNKIDCLTRTFLILPNSEGNMPKQASKSSLHQKVLHPPRSLRSDLG